MITPSETARRAENPTTIAPADARSQERYMLRDLARETKPKCAVCGCRVRSGKAKERSPRCDRHEDVKLSRTDQRYVADPENSLITLPNLRHERDRRKVSRPEMKRRSGVHTDTQRNIENGKHAKLATARKLAAALGLSVEDLCQ